MDPSETPVNKPFNPWLFVPVLYFMQAVPVTVVQEVATVFYKDLGIANESITRWTSLISLPWSLQLLLGPLVDLNATKRRWILAGQGLISFGLIVAALLLRAPHAFELTLLILAATAVTSALCNIATDGFYILAMSKTQQAKFVGVQTTCYRLGRLFCIGLLVLLVGLLSRPADLSVRLASGTMEFQTPHGTTKVSEAKLRVEQGRLVSDLGPLVPETKLPSGVYGLSIDRLGKLTATSLAGPQTVSISPGSVELAQVPPASRAMDPSMAWSLVLGGGALLYGLGHLLNRRTVPKPPEDVPAAASEPGETQRNVLRTLLLVTLGISGYFTINAALRIALNFLGPVLHGISGFDAKGWILPADNRIQVGTLSVAFGPIGTELFQLVLCSALSLWAFTTSRKLIRGTPMADALLSYLRQPGFPAIFCFVLFYRFGEAMVVKMSPLFLKDSLVNGGLAVNNEQLGVIKGFLGVLGIIAGGLTGGAVVSRFGLRKAFLPLAILMHLPNLLYAYAAHAGTQLPLGIVILGPLGPIPMTLAGIEIAEQFGYGFGFAGYMVYLMWVAQRGKYKTTHYAIGTGMGALCIAIAGALSGVLQANLGYPGFFLCAVVLSLPGLLSLRFIPLED